VAVTVESTLPIVVKGSEGVAPVAAPRPTEPVGRAYLGGGVRGPPYDKTIWLWIKQCPSQCHF
jgi:hypothetical protein